MHALCKGYFESWDGCASTWAAHVTVASIYSLAEQAAVSCLGAAGQVQSNVHAGQFWERSRRTGFVHKQI